MVNPSLRRNERLKTRLNRMFQTQERGKNTGILYKKYNRYIHSSIEKEKKHTL